jgi:BASS family bile acid:Na+ symporter
MRILPRIVFSLCARVLNRQVENHDMFATAYNHVALSLAHASQPLVEMEAIARFLAAHAVALLMLAVGLRTPSAIVADIAGRWSTLMRALAVVWIAVPLLALLVVYALQPPPTAAGTLIVMAICPGVPLVLGKSKRSRGDATLSLLVLIATAITALVLVPLWAAVLTHVSSFELTFGMRDAAAVLVPNVVLPFAVGRVIREAAPRIARPAQVIAELLFFAGIAILVVVALVRSGSAIRLLTVRDVAAAALISIGAGALGYIVAPSSHPARVSLTYAAALGNPALALSVMMLSYRHVKVVPFVLAFVLVRAVALLPFSLLFRRQAAGKTI